jgi:hypothetical protein
VIRQARSSALVIASVGLVARLAVVLWAAGTIPVAADGTYYDKLAVRLAEGQGYTWLWPDGVVTPAAHYPVGYPAMLALGYLLFGAKPVVGMVLNAILGSAAGVAAWSLARRATSSSRLALGAGLAVALHPVLVPYTAAIMTEGVTASLLIVAAALAARARSDEPRRLRWLVVVGLVLGVATLVRPQCVVLAPVFGWIALAPASSALLRLRGAAVVAACALAVCAPWTVRNCRQMERCALVSVNGGWNLAIGTQTDNGGWHELAVPEPCKTVFQEAAKDECFGREAKKDILARPGAWIARMPAKLRVTFDYFGAAPWYLHTANAERFPYRAKVALGTIETLASRVLLAAALVAVFRLRGGAVRVRKAIALVGLAACVLVPGTIAYLALAIAILTLGRATLEKGPLVLPATAAVILATAATHAVFFGAGRYGMVVVPFVTALAFVRDDRSKVDLAPSG